ncbi:MAG: double zinc ribbon domain-containing protein, partial [Victivallales bacterium]|nr:double zinc ribbon domain-containing protein [Victivallales bacterium]
MMRFDLLPPVFAVADLAFSFPCPGCGMAPVSSHNALCPNCRERLQLFSPPYCPGCGATLDTALA